MNTIFHQDGHLTDYAFDTLLYDLTLDDLERLEIAEHLSFCDQCVARYSALLEDSLLLSPFEPVAPTVMQRIRERARKIFMNKYATVIVAASFTLVLWNVGIFDFDLSGSSKVLSTLSTSAVSFSEKTTQFTDNIHKLFTSITFERGSNHNEKK